MTCVCTTGEPWREVVLWVNPHDADITSLTCRRYSNCSSSGSSIAASVQASAANNLEKNALWRQQTVRSAGRRYTVEAAACAHGEQRMAIIRRWTIKSVQLSARTIYHICWHTLADLRWSRRGQIVPRSVRSSSTSEGVNQWKYITVDVCTVAAAVRSFWGNWTEVQDLFAGGADDPWYRPNHVPDTQKWDRRETEKSEERKLTRLSPTAKSQ